MKKIRFKTLAALASILCFNFSPVLASDDSVAEFPALSSAVVEPGAPVPAEPAQVLPAIPKAYWNSDYSTVGMAYFEVATACDLITDAQKDALGPLLAVDAQIRSFRDFDAESEITVDLIATHQAEHVDAIVQKQSEIQGHQAYLANSLVDKGCAGLDLELQALIAQQLLNRLDEATASGDLQRAPELLEALRIHNDRPEEQTTGMMLET